MKNENDEWNIAFQTLMKCANPKQMLKLESDSSSHLKLLDINHHYRLNFIFENLNEVIEKIKWHRIVVIHSQQE